MPGATVRAMQRIGAILVGLFLLAFATIMGVAVFTYNPMLKLSQAVDARWGGVQKASGQRAERAREIISVVSRAQDFDRTALDGLSKAGEAVSRLKIDPNQAPYEAAQFLSIQRTQDGLASELAKLVAAAKKSPALHDAEDFRALRARIDEDESRIATERARFNAAVAIYNAKIASFPNVLVARFFHFLPRSFFTGSEESGKPPEVHFDPGARKLELGGRKIDPGGRK